MEKLIFAFVGELNLASINKKNGVRYISLEESQMDNFCNEFRNKKELAMINNFDSYECGVIIHIKKLSQNQDYSVKVKYAESDCDEYIQTEITILQGSVEDIVMAIVAAIVPGDIGIDYMDIKHILNSHKILKFVAIDDIHKFAKDSQRMDIKDVCFTVCDGNKKYGMLDFLEMIDEYMDKNYMLAQESICAMCSDGEVYPPKLYLFVC